MMKAIDKNHQANIIDNAIWCILFSASFFFVFHTELRSAPGVIFTTLLSIYLIFRFFMEPIYNVCSIVSNSIVFVVFRPWLTLSLMVVMTAWIKSCRFRKFCWNTTSSCFISFIIFCWNMAKYLYDDTAKTCAATNKKSHSKPSNKTKTNKKRILTYLFALGFVCVYASTSSMFVYDIVNVVATETKEALNVSVNINNIVILLW